VSQRLVFRPAALKEIHKAAEWYEKRGPGLTAEFLRAVDAAVASVRRNPDQYPVVHKEMRRALLRRFPYSLIYTVSEEELIVLACAHWRQRPSRWQNRH